MIEVIMKEVHFQQHCTITSRHVFDQNYFDFSILKHFCGPLHQACTLVTSFCKPYIYIGLPTLFGKQIINQLQKKLSIDMYFILSTSNFQWYSQGPILVLKLSLNFNACQTIGPNIPLAIDENKIPMNLLNGSDNTLFMLPLYSGFDRHMEKLQSMHKGKASLIYVNLTLASQISLVDYELKLPQDRTNSWMGDFTST